MSEASAEVIVAGHICLDIIPAIHAKKDGMDAIIIPGKLVDVGPAVIATGGAVSNTGLALHRLGIRTKLMGKVGDDRFGSAILDVLKQVGQQLAEGMIVAPGEHSSYTIVLNPPQVDRTFLHCTGANDTFAAADIQEGSLDEGRLFHFGYPPLMRSMYENEGAELTKLLSLVKQKGLTVSLDLAKPDPESARGCANWPKILKQAMPFVDVFLPSLEEILFMLRREHYENLLTLHQTNDLLPYVDGALLQELSEELLQMGAAIVVLKLGEHGLYMRTTANPARLKAMGPGAPAQLEAWLDRELLVSCFEVNVAGTTGAGDCTIAGFIAGLLKGLSPEEVLKGAVAVGAYNVEQADATSGVPSWSALEERIASGWSQRSTLLSLPDWRNGDNSGQWVGPSDRRKP